jgi:signal transduction histidine kinase
MRMDVILLALFAAASAAIALLSWRKNRNLGRRVADLKAKCAEVESEKESLLRTLSVLDSEENERIARLEHDVKSPLGVILGFSALLRESVEQAPGTPSLPIKSINAIQQAATKILEIIDAAVKGRHSRESRASS